MGLLTPPRLSPGAEISTAGGAVVTVQSWRGEGSYAHVFHGVVKRSGRACAVKAPKLEVPEAAHRLDQERQILARLEHRQVVGLLDHAEWNGRSLLVLEWLEGETLRDLITARKRLPLRQALDTLAGLADGLEHIHERGLVHGDLREQNVIVVAGRGPVLTDPLGEGSRAGDLLAAGAAFHRMVTGEAPSASGDRLTTAAGYNPEAVRIWRLTQADASPAAAAVAEQARRLRSRL